MFHSFCAVLCRPKAHMKKQKTISTKCIRFYIPEEGRGEAHGWDIFWLWAHLLLSSKYIWANVYYYFWFQESPVGIVC